MVTMESKCQTTLEYGIRDRVTHVRPVYIGEQGKALINRFVRMFKFSGHYNYMAPLEAVEYYANEVCKGAHRAKNLEALSQMSDGPSRRWYTIRGFGKNEGTKVNKFRADYWTFMQRLLGFATPATFASMRFIAAMDRRGNLDFRRVIGGIETRFLKSRGFELSTPGHQRVFMKGLNTTDRAIALRLAWERFLAPVAYMLDASRFDATVRKELHKAKFHMYMHMLSKEGRAHLARIIPYYLHPKYAATNGIKLKVEGMLMSGVMDTSLTANMVMWMLHSLFRLACLNLHGVGDIVREAIPTFPTVALGEYDWTVLLDGDDCVVLSEGALVTTLTPLINPFYALFGIDMRVEGVVHRFEDIEFCQSKPVEFICGKYKMVRDYRKVVSSVMCSGKWTKLNSYDLKYRLATIGVCETILNLGIPVLQSFALACVRNGDVKKMLKHDVSGSYFRAVIEMRKFGMTELRVMRPAPITHDARESFERAFGMDVQTQKYWEDRFDKWVLPSRHVDMQWDLLRGFWV
jgi:hypothetical protein